MPEINSSTPTDSLTISTKVFTVPQPYSAGHVLTPAEADAMNQAFADRIRSNMAKPVKDALEANTFDQQVFQGQVNDYAETYEFGTTRRGDPVAAEALAIARDLVRKKLVKEGYDLKDVEKSYIDERAKAGILANPKITEIAQARVAARLEVSDIDLAAGSDTGEADAPAAPPKGRKATAPAAATV